MRGVGAPARLGLAVAAIAAALPACDGDADPAPAAVPTLEGVDVDAASFEVVARSNGIAIYALVSVAVDGAPHVLGPGDALSLRREGAEVRLTATDHGYVGTLRGPESSAELVFSRGGEERSATLTLPEAFAIELATTQASVADGISLGWSPIDVWATHRIEVRGLCVEPFTRGLARDEGAYVIQPGELLARGAERCAASVALVRALPRATLALGADSGVTADQIRTAGVELLP